jgi:signal transduction histidine kinase
MLNKNRDQVIRYGKESGIPDADIFFYPSSAYTLNDGKILFGHPNGYFGFYPQKLKLAPGKTQLYITSFLLDNKEIIPGKNQLLEQSIYDTKKIRLNHDQNVFSFIATSIDFRYTGNNKIYYKLENFDKDWHSAVSEEKIQYFKVPPGNYTFRIKTANSSNGEWTEKSIDLVITPPWWATWWAYVLYGILFISAAFLVHRYQRERLIRAERERARTKELAQAKEIEKAYHKLKVTQSQLIQSEKMASLGELTAGVAHEIQNPLNFVNNFSEVNSELIADMNQEIDAGNFKEVKAIAKNIEENEQKIMLHGKRADAIVKGMLQHSRASSGIKEPTDINALADEYTRLAYHGLRAKEKSFNATIKIDFDETIGNISIIPQDIGRVILNLITNAFYVVTEKKKENLNGYEPTVSISTKKMARTDDPAGREIIEIMVKDNGHGIPQKVMDKIFQPFFTTKPTGQGTGLGLSLSYDIIKAHGGEINVKTKEGEGSEFIIQLPQS